MAEVEATAIRDFLLKNSEAIEILLFGFILKFFSKIMDFLCFRDCDGG